MKDYMKNYGLLLVQIAGYFLGVDDRHSRASPEMSDIARLRQP